MVSELTVTDGEIDWRAAKRAQTRDALCRAGRRLFATAPIDSVSIDALVAEAGVSKGSFYNHFTDRSDLVEAVVGEIRFMLDSVVARVNAGEADAARRVARAASVFLRYALEEPEGGAALARIHGAALSIDAPHNKLLVGDIRDGLASGRFAIPTCESGVMLVIGVVQVGMQRILQQPDPALAVATAQTMALLLLRGLGVASDEADRIAAQRRMRFFNQGRM